VTPRRRPSPHYRCPAIGNIAGRDGMLPDPAQGQDQGHRGLGADAGQRSARRFHFPLCRGLCHAEGTGPRGPSRSAKVWRGEAPAILVLPFISAEFAKASTVSPW